MQTIHELSGTLIAKIAAGEVIERPAYAVKELIDNAIDAKATEITIEIEESGLKKILVTDNGSGMSKEDIRICFKPHTTSKINEDDDLYSIKTLGFRGEALWSITAISKTIIKSRKEEDESGSMVELHAGEITALGSVGIKQGTSIEVRDLFSTIPARKKFMRSSTTEFRHIQDIVIAFTLSFPHIGFLLTHNNREIINFSPNQDCAQRAGILFGNELYENLVPLTYEHEYIKLHGFMTKPQASVSSQLKQFLFVNNRRIFDKIISSTVKEAYGTLLEPKILPAYILFMTIPPERLDVNIHPRKEQIAFSELSLVTKAIYEGVIATLSQKNITYHDLRWKRGEYINNTPLEYTLREGRTDSYAAKLLKETVDPWNVNNSAILKTSDYIQVHNTFIIAQTKSGIIMIDQHAAHERILYEQFFEHFMKHIKKNEVYTYKEPLQLELGTKGVQSVLENSRVFENLGFRLKVYANKISVHQIPALYKDKNVQRLILEIVNDLEEEQVHPKIDSQTNKMLAFLACRSAIKAGDKLTKEQAKNLVEKLGKSHIHYTCPHGRPVMVEITLKELYRLFHRS